MVNIAQDADRLPPREDQGKLMHALERLVESKMFIDDTPGISLAEMRAKARRLQQQDRATRPDRDRLSAADDAPRGLGRTEAL